MQATLQGSTEQPERGASESSRGAPPPRQHDAGQHGRAGPRFAVRHHVPTDPRPAGPAACCWAEKGRRCADQSCTGPAAKAAEPHAEPAAIASPTIPSWLPRAETPTRACLGHEDSALLILADLCEPAPILGRRMCSCFDPAVRLSRCWCSGSHGSHCRAA